MRLLAAITLLAAAGCQLIPYPSDGGATSGGSSTGGGGVDQRRGHEQRTSGSHRGGRRGGRRNPRQRQRRIERGDHRRGWHRGYHRPGRALPRRRLRLRHGLLHLHRPRRGLPARVRHGLRRPRGVLGRRRLPAARERRGWPRPHRGAHPRGPRSWPELRARRRLRNRPRRRRVVLKRGRFRPVGGLPGPGGRVHPLRVSSPARPPRWRWAAPTPAPRSSCWTPARSIRWGDDGSGQLGTLNPDAGDGSGPVPDRPGRPAPAALAHHPHRRWRPAHLRGDRRRGCDNWGYSARGESGRHEPRLGSHPGGRRPPHPPRGV